MFLMFPSLACFCDAWEGTVSHLDWERGWFWEGPQRASASGALCLEFKHQRSGLYEAEK